MCASQQLFSDTLTVQRPFCRPTTTMTSSILPPKNVLGMTVLDKSLFAKDVDVPILQIETSSIALPTVRSVLKRYRLKLLNTKSVDSASDVTKRDVLLSPDLVQSWHSIAESDRSALESEGITEACLSRKLLTVGYDNWTAYDILKSVIGDSAPNVAGFSQIGHIIHLNLRDEHMSFRNVIGQVLLDKMPNVKTVINKVNSIENEFRNINYEILAGTDNLVTVAKENNCQFHLDYAQVYWNPRLSTEHERVLDELPPLSTVYDVFAGIGPFAVPAAKKGCRVLANDLNPSSFQFLLKNTKANKVSDRLTPYNLDGREFIRTVVKEDLKYRVKDADSTKAEAHVIMNLPALAEQFVNEFRGLLSGVNSEGELPPPVIHLYCFERPDGGDLVERMTNRLLYPVDKADVTRYFVRQVAPNKDMIRVKLKLPWSLLTESSIESAESIQLTKTRIATIDGRHSFLLLNYNVQA